MKITNIKPHKSSLGIDANIIVLFVFALMAIIWWVPYLRYIAWGIPLAIFFMEKESKFVSFQACTAITVGILRAAIDLLLIILIRIITPSTPTTIQAIFNYNYGAALRRLDIALSLAGFAFVVGVILTVCVAGLAVAALLYKELKLPLIGAIAEKASAKLSNMNINLQSGTVANNTTVNADRPVFCGSCGAKNDAGTKFCGECGQLLT
ncbi:MAG: zinc ribbon domain-containing protein [Defluviitaleaceae bacterium]|nr:zinc ribbon domain-containing protein [Defluviitaleaceae bacterium]